MKATVYYKTEISCAHKLWMGYPSKCRDLHGHNYIIEVWVTDHVKSDGMVVDFHKLKETIHLFDHKYLNELLKQPTAEHLAIHLATLLAVNLLIGGEIRLRVWEDKDSYAEVIREAEYDEVSGDV